MVMVMIGRVFLANVSVNVIWPDCFIVNCKKSVNHDLS